MRQRLRLRQHRDDANAERSKERPHTVSNSPPVRGNTNAGTTRSRVPSFVNGGEDWVISDPSLPNPEDARIRRTARGHAPRSRREREEERRRRQHEEETEERRHRMAVFQELSLADAKNLPEGAGVRVKAAVNASPGTFFRNEWFVQDDSAGLQVRLRHHRPPRLKENELVILDGRITHRRGQTTLLIEEPYHVFELGAGAPLVPLPLRPGDLSADNEGRLVRVSGVVARRADQNLWLADGGSEALIHLWAHHFDRTPPPLLGQQVAVVGINGYYRTSASPRAPWPRLWRPLQRQTAEGAYHLLPRRPADLSTGSGEDRAFNSMLPLRVGSPLSPSGELPGAGAVSAWPRLPATGGGRELERVAAECAC